jgi:hypothetical protein
MSTRQRHLLIAKLLGDLTLTDVERAEIAHCSSKTVQRVRAQLQEAAGDDEPILQQVQRHLREQLPLGRCLTKLIELIEQDEHRPSQLAAIKRYLEMLGVVTAKETKRVEETGPPGPMLIFPADSRPVLVVNQGQALDRESSASEPIDAEAVEVSSDDE